MQVVAPLRGRDRPDDLSDAARPLPDRRQVEEPVVVSADVAVGEGREAGAARPRQPARHALDGPERRRASASTARPRTARSATRCRTAASACTSRRRSGCSTTSTSARRSISSLLMRTLKLTGQIVALAAVAGLLGLLVWKLTHQTHRAEGRRRRRRPSHWLGSTARQAQPRVAARQARRVNFWASWCVPCKGEATMLESAFQQYRKQGVVVRRRRLPRRHE